MPGAYRERAAEAQALARRARTPEERKAFQEIAELWQRLAAQAEATQVPGLLSRPPNDRSGD
jgi:hypothetical protein